MLSTGLVTLIDCKDDIKHCTTLVFSRGLRNWKVYYEGQWYKTYNEVPNQLKKEYGGKIMQSMFKQYWSDDCANKVIRIFPHQNNSGGFFIAKLRRCEYTLSLKTLTFDKRNLATPLQTISCDANKVSHEYVPFQNFTPISAFYKISSEFPVHLVFIKKSCAKSLYIFSEQLAKICNGPHQLKWAHAGVKIFTKIDPKLADGWRFCQQGISLIARYVNHRKLAITPKAAIYLISDKNTANQYKSDYDQWYSSTDIPKEPGGLILVTPSGLVLSAIINKNGAVYPYVPSPRFSVLEVIKQELHNNP